MALIQETGAIVTNANTYALVADLDAFATLRGLELPADTAAKEILLIKAMDYLEAQGQRYKGFRKTQEQPLSWPRTRVILYYVENYQLNNGWENIRSGQYFPDNAIPGKLIAAQCQLAIDIQTVDPMPTISNDAYNVKRETVGPITTEYFGAREVNTSYPLMAKAEALLADLTGGSRFSLRVGRS